MFYQFQHLGNSEYFHTEQGSDFDFPNHIHKSFEFITLISGEMNIDVENVTYTIHPYEGILVFPNQIHSLKSNNSKHFLFIFSPEIVKAYYNKYANKIPKCNKFSFNKLFLKQLESLEEDSPVYSKKGVLYSLCSEFDKQTEYIMRKDCDKNLLSKIFEFVDNNYSKDCSLSKLSQCTGYSYSYLSKYFKNIVKLSYNEYVNMHRISNSCYLLDNTDSTILQCAIESGYDSLRSFNRNFKHIMGMTPQNYKKSF